MLMLVNVMVSVTPVIIIIVVLNSSNEYLVKTKFSVTTNDIAVYIAVL